MQEINSGAFSHDFFGLRHMASAHTSVLPSPTGFANIFSDFTNFTSAKAPVFMRAFAKQLCRRAFAITFDIYTNLTFAIQLCRRAFAITFSIYTNLVSVKHLCRRVFANSHGKPG
jgi:hypothetical protein